MKRKKDKSKKSKHGRSKAKHHKPLSLHSLGMERVLDLALNARELNI
jgi:hypothetical protein